MKTTISLLTLLLVNVIAFAQHHMNWTVINTGTNEKINDVYFHTPDTGYIVGENYLFMKTTNGGLTWTNLPAPSIGERQGNNGNIVGIDYHASFSFSALNSGLYLTWENGFHGVSTSDEGQTYQRFQFTDSSAICNARGFSVLPAQRGNGYINLITYGRSCNNSAAFTNYYDGPFSVFHNDTAFSNHFGSFTSVDTDSSSLILGHQNGYTLRYTSPFSTPSSTFTDSTGIGAIAHAGNGIWYAATNHNFTPIYISTDGGQSFNVDSSFPITFYFPKLRDLDFLPNGKGIGGGRSNGNYGVIVVKDSSDWGFYTASQPINAVQLINDGTAYVVGDSGLVMKTTLLTSINENNNVEHKWQVYPNPTKEIIYLKGLETLNIDAISLWDNNGKLLKNFSNRQKQIDISDIPKGVYIVSVSSNGKQLSKKIVVQ